MEITKFQKKVYEATKKIPCGRVSTYAEIARAIDNPAAVRAVGTALNKNPFAPVVPCHRVVRTDGTLGGFESGPMNKIVTLKSEGVEVVDNNIKDFDKIFFKIK